MAKRPALTDNSFLGFIFRPSKHQQPTGLRKTSLKGTAGRNPRRLRAFNKMSPVQQEVLKRSGQRDAYLKGETTLAKARASLRDQAVQLGVAKPLRPKQTPVTLTRAQLLDRQIQQHLRDVVTDAGRPWNQRASDREMAYLDPEPVMLKWDYGKFKYEGRIGSDYETIVDGQRHNPFWYH